MKSTITQDDADELTYEMSKICGGSFRRGFIAGLQTGNNTAMEKKIRHDVLMWIGIHRDNIPPEAVKSLQDIIGVPENDSEIPAFIQSISQS